MTVTLKTFSIPENMSIVNLTYAAWKSAPTKNLGTETQNNQLMSTAEKVYAQVLQNHAGKKVFFTDVCGRSMNFNVDLKNREINDYGYKSSNGNFLEDVLKDYQQVDSAQKIDPTDTHTFEMLMKQHKAIGVQNNSWIYSCTEIALLVAFVSLGILGVVYNTVT